LTRKKQSAQQEKHHRKRQAQARRTRSNPGDIGPVSFREAGTAVAAVVLGCPLKSVRVRSRAQPVGTLGVGGHGWCHPT
jgi:hypothetical protein